MIKEFSDFIPGYVLRSAEGIDCSRNGISARYSTLYIVRDYVTLNDIEELCKNNKKYECDKFVKVDLIIDKNHFAGTYIRLMPLNNDGKHYSNGGNYLISADSRFRNFVYNCEYPVPIFDRVEWL